MVCKNCFAERELGEGRGVVGDVLVKRGSKSKFHE